MKYIGCSWKQLYSREDDAAFVGSWRNNLLF